MPYFNPKVIAAAAAAAFSGGFAAAAISLQNGLPTTRVLIYAVAGAFLSGFLSGLAGWFKDQAGWHPPTPSPVAVP